MCFMQVMETYTRCILFDSQISGEVDRVRKAGHDILAVCAEVGGTITGEHGVGIEKQEEMALIFSEVDLRVMQQVREAWNSQQLFNPGKLFPCQVVAPI